jgi:hypothetical protein
LQIVEVGDGIWIADGPRVHALGPITVPSRLIAVRLSDGTLWVNSPVEVGANEMDELARLGPIAHLVSPTNLHNWRLAPWHAHFPNARCWKPPEILSDDPPAVWAADLDQVVFRGNAFIEETEFFHRASRTLIVADFIQNYKRLRGVLPDIRFTFIRKELARQSLRKLLAWDFENLIVAHGDCVNGGAKAFVASAFRFL